MMVSDDTALLAVDVQYDFLPGGALAVPDGDAVIAPLNALIPRFRTVVLTQDWHPPGHASFASSHPGQKPFETVELSYGTQVLWPDHCVQGSRGAAIHPALAADGAVLVQRKGSNPAVDSYSAFLEADRRSRTGLAGWLQDRGIRHIVIGGLATDYCVLWSSLDARAAGFSVTVVEEACRGIDLDGSLARALAEMDAAGVRRVARYEWHDLR
jgi:nicotinamidase/pyrazinamidase